jgi:ribosomal protein S18 acetylase RimI-like enzyme
MAIAFSLIPAEPSDTFEICRSIHHEASRASIELAFGPWDEAVEDKYLRESWNQENSQLELIVVENQVAGFVRMSTFPDHLFLADLQLRNCYQSKGIGTEIIMRLLARAKKEKKSVRLEVLHSNTRALALYLRLIFVLSSLYTRIGFQLVHRKDALLVLERAG